MVTVATENGAAVGEGELYIHSEWKVTGYTGTVLSISVSEESKVSGGDSDSSSSSFPDSSAMESILEQGGPQS